MVPSIRLPFTPTRGIFRIYHAFSSFQSNALKKQQGCRWFSVKELSWCAPPGSPNRKGITEHAKDACRTTTEELTYDASDERNSTIQQEERSPTVAPCPFGIVAAMSKNRIIGVDGGLPWNLPSDRQFFVNLTRDKLLIIGRNTLYETSTLSHIAHARATIVVSKTLCHAGFTIEPREQQQLEQLKEEQQEKQQIVNHPRRIINDGTNEPEFGCASDPVIHLVESFPKALEKAAQLAPRSSLSSESMNGVDASDKMGDKKNLLPLDMIDCWVAGGGKIYQEALQHPMAQFLQLTIVDTNIEIDDVNKNRSVALFPPKYRWDHKFRLVVDDDEAMRSTKELKQEKYDDDLFYTRYLYQHINRIRAKTKQLYS